MKLKKLTALILALCMVLSLAACSSSSSSDTDSSDASADADSSEDTSSDTSASELVSKDELIVGTTNEVTIAFDLESVNTNGIGLCYDFLVQVDSETGELYSNILDDWYYEDDTTIVLQIKDGVTFSNGDQLTAEDILYSFEQRSSTDYYENFDWDSSIISDDGLTLTLVTYEPYAPGLISLSSSSIVNKSMHETYGTDDSYWWENSCGTGPYELVEQVDGSYATYQLRDDYWGDETYLFETVTLKYYGEETALFIDYQNGNVDIALNLSSYSYEQLEAGAVENTTIMQHASGNYDVIVANSENTEAWNDVNVRLAIAHAIDWDSLSAAAYDGMGEVLDSIFPSTCIGYVSQGIYEYDPELSMQLLEEAGYGDGLELELLTRDRNSTLVETLQGMLSEVGITLNLTIVEFGVLVQSMASGDHELLITENLTDNLGEPSKIYSTYTSDAAMAYGLITDEYWNELVTLADMTVDEDERLEILAEMQEYAYENCLFIPLMEDVEVWCYNNTVVPEGFDAYIGGTSVFRITAE